MVRFKCNCAEFWLRFESRSFNRIVFHSEILRVCKLLQKTKISPNGKQLSKSQPTLFLCLIRIASWSSLTFHSSSSSLLSLLSTFASCTNPHSANKIQSKPPWTQCTILGPRETRGDTRVSSADSTDSETHFQDLELPWSLLRHMLVTKNWCWKTNMKNITKYI